MKRMDSDCIYRGYRLVNHGYYPPDRCRWWQAENVETGEADFHAHTMRDLKAQIDDANNSIRLGADDGRCGAAPFRDCQPCEHLRQEAGAKA